MRTSADSWRIRAACRGKPASVFFPEPGPDTEALLDQAKAVCACCPVRADCLEEALAASEKLGVWGGLSPAERRRLPRSPGAAA